MMLQCQLSLKRKLFSDNVTKTYCHDPLRARWDVAKPPSSKSPPRYPHRR